MVIACLLTVWHTVEPAPLTYMYIQNKNTFEHLYSAYPALLGGSLALRAECVTRVTRQTGKLNEERSRTTTSRSQQQIRTESKFTATAGIRTSDLRDASASF
jgi:hypothetical protein